MCKVWRRVYLLGGNGKFHVHYTGAGAHLYKELWSATIVPAGGRPRMEEGGTKVENHFEDLRKVCSPVNFAMLR
jgi:hypothetical protein